MKFNPGRYYLGDLCYVLTREQWQAICQNDGEHEIAGRKVWFGGTHYGDGIYFDQFGGEYGVDTGTIGIAPVEIIKPDAEEFVVSRNAGQIINFENEFEIEHIKGNFQIGHIAIITDGSDSDEDGYEEEYWEVDDEDDDYFSDDEDEDDFDREDDDEDNENK